MKKKLSVFLLNFKDQWDIIEEAFSLPVEERYAFILKKAAEKKAEYLGSTEKSIPELSIEMIKKGLKPRSYIKGTPKKEPPSA